MDTHLSLNTTRSPLSQGALRPGVLANQRGVIAGDRGSLESRGLSTWATNGWQQGCFVASLPVHLIPAYLLLRQFGLSGTSSDNG